MIVLPRRALVQAAASISSCIGLVALPSWRTVAFYAFAALVTVDARAVDLADVVKIATGTMHACAITSAGGVKCWGNNNWGQLGDGTFDTSVHYGAVDVFGLSSGVVDIAAGDTYTCAVMVSGTVKCWGLTGGLGATDFGKHLVPIDIPGLSNAVAVAAGGSTCVLLASGAVRCWGELGDDNFNTIYAYSPTDMPTLTSVKQLAGGGIWVTCAVTTAGAAKCWGFNNGGDLGDGTQAPRALPVDVVGLSSAVSRIAVNQGEACVVMNDGHAKCWGGSGFGQLGNPAFGYSFTPVDVTVLADKVSVMAPGVWSTCALTVAGSVKCWGDNSDGQLGQGFKGSANATPSTVVGLESGVVDVHSGHRYSCALTSGGKVVCWGLDIGASPLGAPGEPVTVQLRGAAQTISVAAIGSHNLGDGVIPVSATASSGLPVVFSSLTPSVCTLSESSITLVSIGMCTIRATQAGTVDIAPAQLDTSFRVSGSTSAMPTRLANISTRGVVGTGSDVLIGGFVVPNGAAKTIVITASGPSLAADGVANVLADPALSLVRLDGSSVASNDDWGSAANRDLIQAAGFAPGDSREPAIMVTLEPGAYGAIVSGKSNATGVALVAIYEIDQPDTPLINLSTRGKVLTGDDVMIGGFVIDGTASRKVAIVGNGPSMAGSVAGTLSNPMLQLVRMSDGAVIATNDDWGTASNAAELQQAGFAPSDAREPAILITLPAGAYGAILSGVNGMTGVGLVAVYAVP